MKKSNNQSSRQRKLRAKEMRDKRQEEHAINNKRRLTAAEQRHLDRQRLTGRRNYPSSMFARDEVFGGGISDEMLERMMGGRTLRHSRENIDRNFIELTAAIDFNPIEMIEAAHVASRVLSGPRPLVVYTPDMTQANAERINEEKS